MKTICLFLLCGWLGSAVPAAWGAPPAEETNLPVFALVTGRPLADKEYVPASITYRGRVWQGEIKLRGHSSFEYPKKSLTLKFADRDRFGDSRVAGGFVGKRKVALTTTFDDNSYLRHRLAFELWNRLGAGRIRVQAYSAIVYLNGEYQGLYVVSDHIDGDLLASQGFPKKGNLYMAVDHGASFFAKTFSAASFEKKEGCARWWFGAPDADLKDLSDFVANSDDGQFRADIGRRVELGDYRAWFIAVTAMEATDSQAKNAFHFHDPVADRWRVVPWDFNESWGQDWTTARALPVSDPEAMAGANNIFRRLLADPVLGAATRAQYAAVLRREIALPEMLRIFDALVSEIAPAAHRDEQRWRAAYLAFPRWQGRPDFTTFDSEVAYIRQWIRDRWAFLEHRYPRSAP